MSREVVLDETPTQVTGTIPVHCGYDETGCIGNLRYPFYRGYREIK